MLDVVALEPETSTSRDVQNATLLWTLRNWLVGAPHIDLPGIRSFDDQLERHLTRIAGERDGGRLSCLDQSEGGGAAAAFVAASVALALRDDTALRTVVGQAMTSRSVARGVISALGWADWQMARRVITGLCASDSASLQRIAVAGSSIHRVDPGDTLDAALESDDPALLARA